MSMTMQKVDNRHRLSLPSFYPDYKPGLRRSRNSKDVQSLESSSMSPRLQPTHRSSHKSTRQQWESNSSGPNETSLKSCLRKYSEKDENAKQNMKDADRDIKSGDLKDVDSVDTSTPAENSKKFSKRKWRATKIGHKDSADGSRGEENSDNTKMKGSSYTRFRYPLRFHYGSSVQSKSRMISAVPDRFRTFSFYSSLPRRQRQIVPENISNEKRRSRKDGKRNNETKTSPEQKTEDLKDKGSRTSSPDRELNGVYHIVHETETAEVHDTKAAGKHESNATHEHNTRTTQNQHDSDDDEASEVKDDDADGSKRLSSKSSHSDRSEGSIKEVASCSHEGSLKKDESEIGSSDDEDMNRSRKKEGKHKKKKKKVDKDKRKAEYAADFDDNSEVLTEE